MKFISDEIPYEPIYPNYYPNKRLHQPKTGDKMGDERPYVQKEAPFQRGCVASLDADYPGIIHPPRTLPRTLPWVKRARHKGTSAFKSSRRIQWHSSTAVVCMGQCLTRPAQ